MNDEPLFELPRNGQLVENLNHYLKNLISEERENVSYKQWTHTDGKKLETILAERDDYIEKLVALVNKLTTHHFVARNQSAYFVQSKENIDHETCVLVSDFSENFSFVIRLCSRLLLVERPSNFIAIHGIYEKN
jgi:hypothetical protein